MNRHTITDALGPEAATPAPIHLSFPSVLAVLVAAVLALVASISRSKADVVDIYDYSGTGVTGVATYDATTGLVESAVLSFAVGYTLNAGGNLYVGSTGKVTNWLITGITSDGIGQGSVCGYYPDVCNTTTAQVEYGSGTAFQQPGYTNLDDGGMWTLASTSGGTGSGGSTAPPSPFATEKAIFAVIGPAMSSLANVFTVMGIALAPLDQAAKLVAIAAYQKAVVYLAGLSSSVAGEFTGSAEDVANLFGDINSGFLRYIATKGKFTPISILLSFDALEADQIAALSAKIVADPPDPNFTSVAPPSSFAIASPNELSVGPYLAPCQATQTSFANSIEFLEAGLTAAERYQGAVIAGANISAGIQLAAFDNFLSQSQISTRSLSADLASCLQGLQELGLPNSPDVASEIANALGQPLDPDVVEALSPTGVDQATLNSLLTEAEDDLLAPGFGANASEVFSNVESGLDNFAGTQGASPVAEPDSLAVLLAGLSLLLGYKTCAYLRKRPRTILAQAPTRKSRVLSY